MRGGGELMPMTRRVVHAATLLADPSLQEPVYLGEDLEIRPVVSCRFLNIFFQWKYSALTPLLAAYIVFSVGAEDISSPR